MAVFVSGFRDALYNASYPPGTHLGVMAFSAAVSLLIGLTIFGRLNRRFAEEL
jgi:ABC-type polysaccharide/polyol phosphate export permease